MDKAKILSELTAAYLIRDQRAFEFTRSEFAKAANCDYSVAKRILENLVDEGTLKAEVVHTVDGRRARVYWRPEDEEESL